MSRFPEPSDRFPNPSDPDDWQPATSRPGEIYTFEGSLKADRAFLLGLKKSGDPRLKPYRRSMYRMMLVIIAVAVMVPIVAAIVSALS